MRRDPRLGGLSSDHHHALVLARRIREADGTGVVDAALVAGVRRRFVDELAPHFAIEEEILLPALSAAGRRDLAERTAGDHRQLEGFLAAACAGRLDELARFGQLLEQHVRFEERALFPACEALLPASIIDAVEARAPKARPSCI